MEKEKYYITTAIINRIIENYNPYEIIIMIQKEVAERFMSKPNNKSYNSLSIFLQYNFEIEKICDVSKNCFKPIPKVDSMVIKLKNRDKKIYEYRKMTARRNRLLRELKYLSQNVKEKKAYEKDLEEFPQYKLPALASERQDKQYLTSKDIMKRIKKIK